MKWIALVLFGSLAAASGIRSAPISGDYSAQQGEAKSTVRETANPGGKAAFSLSRIAAPGAGKWTARMGKPPLPGSEAKADSWTTVTFRESEALFANPGIGWMWSSRRQSAPRFPYSVTYFRVSWMDLEPEEGRFDWSRIDRQIESARRHGMRVAFRVMTASAHSAGYYTSPKWLFDEGCKSFDYTVSGDPASGGERIPRIEPDYSDPIYLAKHARLLAELGKRYDGNPDIQFLDIGSYGIWGEWHTPHPVSLAVRQKIIAMYADAFPHTALVAMTDDDEALPYALKRGAGLRRDGVGSPWHEQHWIGSKKYAHVTAMADTWKRKPVVFEWFLDYEYMRRRGWPFDRAIRFMLDNHVSLINDNIGEFPPEAGKQLSELTRRAGYRFVLREASFPKQAAAGSQLTVKMQWSNVGVAKLYSPYALELSLIDASGAVVSRTRTTVDPTTWLPGNITCEGAIDVGRNLEAGEYGIGVALVDANGRPSIRLAIDQPDVALRYEVGKTTVVPGK